MSGKKQRLELTWIDKDVAPKLEPRILLEQPEQSYTHRRSATDLFDNRLVHGDNLLALRALEAEFSGKVRCIFIDPPYNTGSAFTHYDDGIEHSLWLSLIKARLEILWKLLCQSGSIWITIDDTECHYLKVLCDELFGRVNFVTSIAWEKDQGRRGDTDISSSHDHILLYAKDRDVWRKSRNLLPRSEEQESRYRNPDNDPRGRWLQGDNGTAKSGSEGARFAITLPSGRVVTPPKGNYWRFSRENFERASKEGRVHFGNKGDSMPVIKRYLTEVQQGVVPRTWWPAEETGTNQGAKRDHLRKLLPAIEPFATPKPEELLQRILLISTSPGDLVLDSFAGSGTTGAVAHKMGRRWIMVELHGHCETHIIPRLKKVIDGEDKGGITEAVSWEGGGGFRYFRLAPSLLEKDRWGNWVIARSYNAAMLAEAMCKHMGFTYAPSQDPAEYWRHGHSSERDFIFVTTANVTHDQLRAISEDVGPERTLLVCCKAFNARADAFENLTVKEDTAGRAFPLRMGPRRLQPPHRRGTALTRGYRASGSPGGSPAQAGTTRRGRKNGTIAVLGHGCEGRR